MAFGGFWGCVFVCLHLLFGRLLVGCRSRIFDDFRTICGGFWEVFWRLFGDLQI